MLPALFPLLDRLLSARVQFVVIGGIAVVVHGATRTTEDVDIVPDPALANLLTLGNLMAEMGAHLASDTAAGWASEHHDALAAGRSLSLSTGLGELDIVQRLPGLPPYSELRSSAVEVTLASGHVLPVASLAHLRAMKRAAGRPQDLADLDRLRRP